MKIATYAVAAMIALNVANTAHAEGMKPGLWEFATQMSGADMPAMPAIPADQRKQMEAMGIKLPQAGGAGMSVTSKVCITPEQAKKGVPPNSDKESEKCEQTDVKTSGKTTSWKMVCRGKQKMTGSGAVTHDNAEHFHGESTMNMQDGPKGAMTMNNKFSGRFLSADCKQAK